MSDNHTVQIRPNDIYKGNSIFMRKSIFLCACATVALCFVSCVRDELQRPDSESTGFGVMVQGRIDPAQTFNLANEQFVTVTAPSESMIRVYAYDGHSNKLVAKKKINGTEKIVFDAPASVKKVTVLKENGGKFRSVEVGGSVSFPSTRSVIEGNDIVKTELDDNYMQFDYTTVMNDIYTNMADISDKTKRAGAMKDAFKNINNASTLFYSESGSFTLNLCWYTQETGGQGVIGIWYYDDDDNLVSVPIFRNDKLQDMLQYETPWNPGNWLTYSDAHMPSLNWGPTTYHSKGIKVTVPAKTAFGFYVENGYDVTVRTKFYSDPSLNQVPTWGYNENDGKSEGKHWIGDDLGKYGHVAMIEVEGRKYLGFDDWLEGNNHQYYYPEYDHLVFSYSGDLTDQICEPEPEPQPESDPEDPNKGKISPDTLSWILACEDLGESADYDFNDVVLKITHVAGAEKASVTLMAAGGTLKSNVWFGDQDLGEVHELFGIVKDTLPSINTWQQLNAIPSVSLEIDVPADFTMSAENMGGFKIVRNGIGGIVAAPEAGMVPYMICIPGTWKWPRETKRISNAYPSFAEWVKDHTTNLDWYEYPVDSLIYSK